MVFDDAAGDREAEAGAAASLVERLRRRIGRGRRLGFAGDHNDR